MPRASSRSSSSARVSSSWAAPTISAAFSGDFAIWFWAIRSVRLSATSRCWAPSCRLRSSRRRSLRPASTIRARERRSAASRRSPRMARLAAAATPAEHLGLAGLGSWTIAPIRWPSSSTGVSPATPGGSSAGLPSRVDPRAVDPVQELQRVVVERVGQQAAQAVGGGRLAELDQQLADRVGVRHPAAQQADQEREGHARRRRSGRRRRARPAPGRRRRSARRA